MEIRGYGSRALISQPGSRIDGWQNSGLQTSDLLGTSMTCVGLLAKDQCHRCRAALSLAARLGHHAAYPSAP